MPCLLRNKQKAVFESMEKPFYKTRKINGCCPIRSGTDAKTACRELCGANCDGARIECGDRALAEEVQDLLEPSIPRPRLGNTVFLPNLSDLTTFLGDRLSHIRWLKPTIFVPLKLFLRRALYKFVLGCHR